MQYWAAGSSSYIAAGCREASGASCAHLAFYAQMHVRACECDWGPPTPMVADDDDFVWRVDVRVGSAPQRIWIDVAADVRAQPSNPRVSVAQKAFILKTSQPLTL